MRVKAAFVVEYCLYLPQNIFISLSRPRFTSMLIYYRGDNANFLMLTAFIDEVTKLSHR